MTGKITTDKNFFEKVRSEKNKSISTHWTRVHVFCAVFLPLLQPHNSSGD